MQGVFLRFFSRRNKGTGCLSGLGKLVSGRGLCSFVESRRDLRGPAAAGRPLRVSKGGGSRRRRMPGDMERKGLPAATGPGFGTGAGAMAEFEPCLWITAYLMRRVPGPLRVK